MRVAGLLRYAWSFFWIPFAKDLNKIFTYFTLHWSSVLYINEISGFIGEEAWWLSLTVSNGSVMLNQVGLLAS